MATQYVTFACLAWLLGFSLAKATSQSNGCSPRFHQTQGPFYTVGSPVCPTALGDCSSPLEWSQEPTCIRPSRASSGSDIFCVYTSDSFRFGRGISIITSPSVAITISDNYSPPAFAAAFPAYRPQELGGRGIGLYATHIIQTGDTIDSSPPVIVFSRVALASLTREERHVLQRKALEQLPWQTARLFRKLAKSRGGDEDDDITQTNSIGMSFVNGAESEAAHLAVIPEAARINHACRPNAYYRLNETTLNLEVFALRHIPIDEEITFSYGFAELPHDRRQEALNAHWSFTCTCSLCSAPASTIAASDARLTRIADLKASLPSPGSDLPLLLESIEGLVRLYDEEGLIMPKARCYEIAAYTCSQMGDEEGVKKWAGLAGRLWGVIAGKGSQEVRAMEALAGNPRGHGSWGGR